jgi:hypothetical protein
MTEEEILNRKQNREVTESRRRRLRQQSFSALTALISVVLVSFTFYSSTTNRKVAGENKAELDQIQQRVSAERDRLMALQIESLEGSLKAQRNELDSFKLHLGTDQPESAVVKSALARLDTLETGFSNLKEQNDALTTLLGDDPFKKMSLVILSRDVNELKENDAKDIANLTDRYKVDIAAIRDENKSQFDFIKWAVLFAGVSNLLGPVGGLFLRRKQSDTDK